MKKTHRKLELKREAVRTLVEAELGRVAGGESCNTGAASTCSMMVGDALGTIVPK